MKIIDQNNWERKEHFAFFYRMDYPQYNISCNMDVSRFHTYIKEQKLPFYYAMIYMVTRAANECTNFKYRIRKGEVVLHDILHPSFTDMDTNTESDLFKMVTVEMAENVHEFVRLAKETSENQKEFFYFEPLAGRDDFLYITCLPWISFTHMSHTISLNRDDAVPRISWGKYFREGDKLMLPFSVQVHHALVDGIHIGQYLEKLQSFLDEPETIDY